MDLSETIVEQFARDTGIDLDELKRFLALGQSRRYRQGEYLFHESSPREWLGIVLEGRLELVRGLSGRNITVGCLAAGAVISESLLIDDHAHSVSGFAETPVAIWAIDRAAVEAYQEEHPDVYFRLVARAARRLSTRLRDTTSMLLETRVDRHDITGHRREHDSLGPREISEALYYGVQTVRAIENFPLSGIRLSHFQHFIDAFAYVKKAAAAANAELGVLDPAIAKAITEACDEILDGALHDHFAVDMVQGGAGTSSNMNANEVIANRALELLGHRKGDYHHCHPNDHVNCSQSTNDAYPTAVKLAIVSSLEETLSALRELRRAFKKKATEFSDVIKMGRTENQDAVPMTLGQEFAAYAVMIKESVRRLERVSRDLLVVNMGATAIGTGLNTPRGYAELCTAKLAEFTGYEVRLAGDLVEATQDAGDFAAMSSALKVTAIQVSKICNDLRWASSGPRCGLNEINLPALQPGSSIMPGKVNPVVPEVVNQVCYQIIGADTTVSMAAEASEFELNMAEPIMAYSLLSSLMLLKNAAIVLTNRCVSGITANRDVCEQYVRNSIGIVTALNPVLGYERSAAIAKEALATNGSVYDLVLDQGLLTKEQLDELLSPAKMARPLMPE